MRHTKRVGHYPEKTDGKAITGRFVLPGDVPFGNRYLKNPVAILIALLLLGLTCTAAGAGTLGGEPADFVYPGPTFTVTATGANTVTGTIGPTGGVDSQDAFEIVIPSSFQVTTVSYSGPSDANYALNLVGCGLTGTSNLNQTLNSSNCILSYSISANFAVSATPWTVTANIIPVIPICTNPSMPTVTAFPTSVCPGVTSHLGITGNLNDATAWYVYTGSCGGTLIGTTATSSFVVTPGSPSTTYYIRGEGGCVTPGSCGSRTVTASDTTNPSITCPVNQTVNADGSGLFTLPDYTGLATPNDNCTASPTVTQLPVPDATIGVGTTAITLTATDGSGNSVNCNFDVLVSDVTPPTVTSVSAPVNGTYIAGQNLDFTVNFGENVTVNTAGGTPQLSVTIGATIRQAVYISGSGSGALLFRYTVQSGELDTDGIAVGTLSANGGTLRDAAANNANLTLNGVGSTTAVFVDSVPPTVSSVNVPANATYVAGQNLDFTVNFGENVTVNTAGGTPQLSVTIGATTRQAVYLSGSGSGALVFRYTIQAGELDTAGIAVGTLSANGGILRDAASNNANLTLNSVGSTAAVFVDAVDPTVTEITPVTTPTNDSTPSATFNTTEAGTLTVGGSCGSASEGAIGSGNQTIALTQSDNSTPFAGGTYGDCTVTVTDAAGNANTPVILTSFTVDLQAPTVSEVTPVVTPGNDSTPDVTISTNEAGVLSVGGSCGSGNEGAIPSGNTTVTLTQTDNSSALAGGTYSDCTITVTDAAGNSSTPVTLTSFIIDTQAPAVTAGNIGISGATGTGGAFKVGDIVIATWNNTAGGDNNDDISSVTVDFSQFGGGSAVSATNSGGIWTATFTITEDGGGIIEASNRNVSVTATDNVGNSTTTADTINATVDNNSPTVPSVPDMLAASDLGSSSTDNWTLDTTPTFVGTAEIDALVSLTSDVGGPIGTNGPIASTSWVVTSSVLSEGSHNITAMATDAAGNTSASSSPLACMIDATDPVVTVPANIAVNTDPGQPTAIVSWTAPSATDNQDGSLTPVMTAGLASGSAFPVGLTTETFTATDTAGNSASSSFTITVSDNEAPVINGMPTDMNITTSQSTITAVPVSWTEPTATDVVDGAVVPVQTAGITNGGDFPIGDTIVTYTATDLQGNSKSASFTVTIVQKPFWWIIIPGLISPNKVSGGSE